MMKLLRFRVTNFRSVDDSGWIEVENVTALIGTNESGKTNVLVPLWKLHPAKDGQINPIADYPRKRYNEIRAMEKKPTFIAAEFTLSDELVGQLAQLTDSDPAGLRMAKVTRDFSGAYTVAFPCGAPPRLLPKAELAHALSAAEEDLASLDTAVKSDELLKEQSVAAVVRARHVIASASDQVDATELEQVKAELSVVSIEDAPKRSTIAPRFGQLVDAVAVMVGSLTKPHPNSNAEARKLVMESMPHFVYYSTYGNLDSEIYLPHVIENLKRSDLGTREEAKARTLRVLFSFVGLDPKEILDLGRDLDSARLGRPPTADEIQKYADQKKERDVLLQSAGSKLTSSFRDWWKQGDYRFRFSADGDHFRIWVSDDRRPEEIELEGRSTGLQWFLSFYLVFLVESAEAHRDAMVLLDEAGQSLHPIAQRDLRAFFDNLARTNGIIYTTHSPFLVDPDRLDRVKVVYLDGAGATVVSGDLRAAETNPAQTRSIYPVHAALGLTVSDALLEGCQPVIVEGPSDQHYLSALKGYLLARGSIAPRQELVFIPAGGVRGVKAVAAILVGRDERLPYVLLDSDAVGLRLAESLKADLYHAQPHRLLLAGDFVNIPGAEIEDLLPPPLLIPIIARYLAAHGLDDPDQLFTAGADAAIPIIPKVKTYAEAHGVVLEDGWKVEIAKQFRARLMRDGAPDTEVEERTDVWRALFAKLTA